jgi:hypothetical protein
MNAMKNVIMGAVNGLAATYFLMKGAYVGAAALVMAAGMITGGYAGAAIARRVDPKLVRWLVVAIGLVLAGLLAWRRWR